MHYFEQILRVLITGLIVGAGLPALFAAGLVSYSAGLGSTDAGALAQPKPILKVLGIVVFALVALAVVAAILWICRATIVHHLGAGADPFPFLKK
jgi:hypothetical protein